MISFEAHCKIQDLFVAANRAATARLSNAEGELRSILQHASDRVHGWLLRHGYGVEAEVADRLGRASARPRGLARKRTAA